MNEDVANELMGALTLELDNIVVDPQNIYITMSPEFYEAIGKPADIRGAIVTVNPETDVHWKLLF